VTAGPIARPMVSPRPAKEIDGRPRTGRPDGARPAGARPVVARRTRLRRDAHQPDYMVLVAIVALVAIGILMVYSSSAMRAYASYEDTLRIVGPQIFWGTVGLGAMVFMSRIDYRWLRAVSIPLYIGAIALLVIVLIPGLGIRIGGSARWLQIGPLPAVHPAEIAKLAMVVYLAHWFARRGTEIRSFRRGTLPFLFIFAPVVFLVLREPDLGTSAVIGITGFVMFFAAGATVWHLLAIGGLGAGVVLFSLTNNAYQLDRVTTFLDPWRDPLGTGFHTIQGLLALGLGGLVGAGLGESRQAGGLFLPNAWNDYVFAVVGEEFGLLGAMVVIGLFVIFAYRGMKVALAAPDTFGALMAAGITTWICIQAFINIGVVVSLIPVTGITLPFVSAGGSSLVVSFIAVGILLSISREAQASGMVGDAGPHRGRRHRRAHLPRPRRRSVADGPRGAA
jgi:cell division protein FtsW